MANRKVSTGLALALALSLSSAAAPGHASEIGSILARADALRSSDTRTFASLLARAEALQARATQTEREHLRFLKAYQRVIAGDYSTAIAEAKQLSTRANTPEIRYRSALLVANTSAVTRDYAQGLQYLERSLALEKEITDDATRHAGAAVAAILYNQLGEHDRALAYAERLLREPLDPRTRCVIRMERAEALVALDAPIDETRDLHDAIADCRAQGNAIPLGILHTALAEHYASHGRTAQAISLLESNLPDIQATGYSRLIGEVYGLLARYRMESGDVAGAERAARQVLGLKGQTPGWLPVVTAQHVLYRTALARGDATSALDHYRRYAEAEKGRLDDIKAREYALRIARHEWMRQQQAMKLLEKENDVLRLEKTVASRTAWALGLLAALLLATTAFAAFNVRRSRHANRSLRRMAETDALTGVSNRRHFRASTERALALCAQDGTPVSVLLLDLDHFKQINDECGHSAGDWVLREVARVGRAEARTGNPFGRIGGEEFAMALIGCDLEHAMAIAEKCRSTIAAIDASPAPCHRPVTASIGVASTATAGYDYEELLAHADAAMYRSKVAGRNRVTATEPHALQREAS